MRSILREADNPSPSSIKVVNYLLRRDYYQLVNPFLENPFKASERRRRERERSEL